MNIFLIEIPKSSGHEQQGLRPAIIVSRPHPNISMIIPLTSNLLAEKFDNTLILKATEINKLTTTSIALIFQMRAIDNSRIQRKLGKLSVDEEENIRNSLRNMLNL